MCGIAGIIDLSGKPLALSTVKAMCSAMGYRGPDAEDSKSLPCAVLGHRRLAILDLSPLGNQPMSTPDEKLWIVFNGEIYNHSELRSELQRLGFAYRSRTDTESLLYGYRVWGEQLPIRCRGMWAFAIWDAGQQSLFLCRDRLGEKPLLYYQQGSMFAFASNLAGLRPALPQCNISPEAVASLLAYEYIPHTESIYVGVKKLPPAHYLVFNRDGVRVEPYWQLDYRHKLDITLGEAEDRIEELINNAVLEQLEADVPVGTFLSGGVDSGYITALAARHKPEVISVTMAVPGSSERDESYYARTVASAHNTTHIEVPLDQSCIRDLPSLLTTIEPLGDSSLIPTSAVSKAGVSHVKVVLTGDGGDEGFDGYGKPRVGKRAAELRSTPTGRLWKLAAPVLRYLSLQRTAPGLRLLRLYSSHSKLLASAGIEAFLATYEATPPAVRKLLYGPGLRAVIGRPLGESLIQMLYPDRQLEWWEAILDLGLKTRLPDDFLLKVDTATMFHSLESRAPLLDYRVIELIARLPFEIWQCDQHPKALLKRLAARYNPPDIVYRGKKGFSIPVEQYLKEGWGTLLLELTRDGVAAQMGWLDPDGVRTYLQRHSLLTGYRLSRQLFTILVLELWLRVFHTRIDEPDTLGQRLLRSVQGV